jgi:hypothetical protein
MFYGPMGSTIWGLEKLLPNVNPQVPPACQLHASGSFPVVDRDGGLH